MGSPPENADRRLAPPRLVSSNRPPATTLMLILLMGTGVLLTVLTGR